MPCCGCEVGESDKEPFPRSLEDGKYVNRGCTDKTCLVIFVLFLAGMGCEVLWAISQKVDPRRLTHGVDYQGRICGVDVPEEWVYWCGSTEREGAFPKSITHDSTVCLQSCPTNSSLQIACLMPFFHNVSLQQGGTLKLSGGAVKNMQTLSMVVTQSIAYQPSYPTQPYAGKFCMPARSSDSTLRDEIINGPYAWRYRAGSAFASAKRAAPLLLGVAVLTVALGYLYLLILRYFAGLLIFIVMVISVVLLTVTGIFFLFAIFVSGDDENSYYHSLNPIFRTYIGWEATWSSLVTGAVLLAAASCLGLIMCKTCAQIDEAVGVVAAACECLEKESSLMLFPLLQTGAMIVLIVVLLIMGLPWVAALGHMDTSVVSVNGIEVDGLFWSYRKSLLDKFLIAYYLFGCWWIIEFFIAFGQFVVSYVVCLWYFQEGTETEAPLFEGLELAKNAPAIPVQVRLTGVDDHYLPRDGLLVRVANGEKVLIAPVEDDKAFGPEELDRTEFEKPSAACAIVRGVCVGFWNHMGSMAYGCLLVAACRPFAMFSECLNGFVRTQEGITDGDEDEEDGGDEAKPPEDSGICSLDTVTTLCSYLRMCMNTIFGGFTKNAYTEIVLTANEWKDSSEASMEFLESAGGSVAYLSGACFVYEVFGGLCITLVSVLVFIIVATKMDQFANPSSSWYIPNLYWATVFATVIASVTSFEFMQVFNHTADTLLYAFAWNRQLAAAAEEFAPTKYCPGALRDMMEEYELEPGGPPELEGEYTAADYIMRAGFEYPVRRLISRSAFKSAASSSIASSRLNSSRFFGGSEDSLSISDLKELNVRENPLEIGNESARELSFR